MPRKKVVAPVAETPAVVIPQDAAVAVYKDRAGGQLGGGPSEGKVNFAAVTDAARSILNRP